MKLKIADRFINSFFPHDSLNPSIYNEGGKMKPAVHQAIMLVIEEFLDTIEYDLTIADIESVLLTGSLANYNYNKWSDADLHLLVDYSKFDEDKKFVRDYLRSKAINWNDRHKVTIYGHEIEIYFQDVNEPHHSTGIYDVAKDRWSVEPKKIDNKDVIDENLPLAFNKADYISIEIDKLASRQDDATIEKIDILKDKIKKMRQSGLERDGEYSIENIAFKILRRRGDLKLLHQAARIIADKNLSIPKILDEDQEWWKKRRSLDNKNYRELLGYSGKKSTFKRKYASKKTGYPKSANRRKIAKSGKPYMHNPRLKLGISAPPGVMQEREIAPTEEAEKGTFSILRALSNNTKIRDRVISNVMKNTNQKFLMLRKERRFATEKCLKGHSYEFVRSPGGWQMRLVDDINKIKHPDNILIDPKECLYNQGRPMDLDETGLINILDDELETSRAVEIKTDNGLSYHVPGFSTVVAKAAEPTKKEPKKPEVVSVQSKLSKYIEKIDSGVVEFYTKEYEIFVGVPPLAFLPDRGAPYTIRFGKKNALVVSENLKVAAAMVAYRTALAAVKYLPGGAPAKIMARQVAKKVLDDALKEIKDRAPATTKIEKEIVMQKLDGITDICKTLDCNKSFVYKIRKVGRANQKFDKVSLNDIIKSGASSTSTTIPTVIQRPRDDESEAEAQDMSYVQEAIKWKDVFRNGKIKEEDPRAWPHIAKFWKVGTGSGPGTINSILNGIKYGFLYSVDKKLDKEYSKSGRAIPSSLFNDDNIEKFYNYYQQRYGANSLRLTLEEYKEEYRGARGMRNDTWWSAAFINYCMRNDEDFQKMIDMNRRGSHKSYWQPAKENTRTLLQTKDVDSVTWIYLTKNVAEAIGWGDEEGIGKPGDIVFKRMTTKDFRIHGDIKTNQGRIGGNLSNSVKVTRSQAIRLITKNPEAKKALLEWE